MTLLRQALLANYDMTAQPPRFNSTRGALVQVQMAMQQFQELDTTNQQIAFISWWRHYWTDPRLAWNPDHWGGITELTFFGHEEHKQIWTPDTIIYEAIESDFQIPGGVQPNVYSDGSVFQSNIIENRLNCPMKPRTFPFDQQECVFTFGCWSTHGFQVDVKPRGDINKPAPFSLAASYEPNPEFDLLEVRTTAFDFTYGCCPEPYPILKYKFRMRRHSETYNYGLVVPMILTTLAGFLAFVANPQSGERISLGITCLLTSAAIYIVAFEVLPKTGNMTIISMLHVISFSFSWATLAVSVLSVSLYGVKTSTGVMSEHELVSAFVKADHDHSGVLDKKEVEEAVKKLGLPSAKFFKLRKKLDSLHGESITLPVWYDLVGNIYQTDGLAAYHSPIIGLMLAPFVKIERRRRKDFVLQRVQAAIDRNDLGNKVLTDALLLSSPGLRRRQPSTSSVSPGGSTTPVGANAKRVHLQVPAGAVAGSTCSFTLPSGTAIQVVIPEGSVPGAVLKVADPGAETGAKSGSSDDEEAPSPQSGGNVRLEDLVTDHELSDSSEIVARRVAGYLDLGAMIVLPLCYMIVVIVYFERFGAMMAEEEFEKTKVVHVAPEDF